MAGTSGASKPGDAVEQLLLAAVADIAAALVRRALEGDVRAQLEILERVLGKSGAGISGAKEYVTLRIITDFPPAEDGPAEG